jgi:hypothetical protein
MRPLLAFTAAALTLTTCVPTPVSGTPAPEPIVLITPSGYLLNVTPPTQLDVQYEDDQPDPLATCDHQGGHWDPSTFICKDVDY